MTSGRGPCVQPHQNFPVTHLQLYFTVSCLHLVHLLAEPQLESCCKLMWEAGRQGNAGLIHLQPETCRKSFTLCVAQCANPQSSVLHPLSGQHRHTQSASGWRRMAASGQEGCTLAKTNQHEFLNPTLLLLLGNNFLDWFSLSDITIKPLCHPSSHGNCSWSPAAPASKGQSLWGCVEGSEVGWVCLTPPKLGATPLLPAAAFGCLQLHRGSHNDPRSKRHWDPASRQATPGDAALSQELQVSCVHPATTRWRNKTAWITGKNNCLHEALSWWVSAELHLYNLPEKH